VIEVVTRRVFSLRSRHWLLWVITRIDGYPVRRMLVDLETGELIDHVWKDDLGRTLSGTSPSVPTVTRTRCESTNGSREAGPSQGYTSRCEGGVAARGGAPHRYRDAA